MKKISNILLTLISIMIFITTGSIIKQINLINDDNNVDSALLNNGENKNSTYSDETTLATKSSIIKTELEEPKLNYVQMENRSLGVIGITPNFDNYNSPIDHSVSGIQLYEGDELTGTLVQKFSLTEESGYTYITNVNIKSGTTYTAITTLKTEYPRSLIEKDDILTLTVDQPNIEDITITTTDSNFYSDDGLIEISMDFSQKAANDITGIMIRTKVEQTYNWHPEIIDLTYFNQEETFSLDHTIRNLPDEVHNLEILVYADSLLDISGRPINHLTQSHIVDIGVDSETFPTIGEFTVNDPTLNDHGQATYNEGDIKVGITLPEVSTMPWAPFGNPKFKIEPSGDYGLWSDAVYFKEDSEICLWGTITIPQEVLESGYSIFLTEIDLQWTSSPTEDILIAEVAPITVTLPKEGLTDGAIVGIIIGSIVGVGLLGAGGLLAYNNKEKFASKPKPKA